MVTEHALLDIQPGQEPAFERAFEQARAIIDSVPGFVDLRLLRGVERPSCYLLLVDWETLEDHTEGFRGSPQYQEWRRLLHHFFVDFPTVEHFERGAPR